MELNIRHAEAACRFLSGPDEAPALAEYTPIADGTTSLVHTFVPPERRGSGEASALMQAFSEWARQSGVKVRPVCSYAVLFYRKHKEFSDILSGDTDLENGGACRIG